MGSSNSPSTLPYVNTINLRPNVNNASVLWDRGKILIKFSIVLPIHKIIWLNKPVYILMLTYVCTKKISFTKIAMEPLKVTVLFSTYHAVTC